MTDAKYKTRVLASYKCHHQFYWIRPRRAWFDAKCPVYIDFGGELLYRLEQYDETRRLCVRLVAKRKLIHDAMAEKPCERHSHQVLSDRLAATLPWAACSVSRVPDSSRCRVRALRPKAGVATVGSRRGRVIRAGSRRRS